MHNLIDVAIGGFKLLKSGLSRSFKADTITFVNNANSSKTREVA